MCKRLHPSPGLSFANDLHNVARFLDTNVQFLSIARLRRVLINVRLRKLRNRLSQQAFRERQAFYVMELEKRLQNAHKTESARMAELEAQNRAMRDQLLDYRKRLRSVQASLEGVTVAMTDTLFDKVRLFPGLDFQMLILCVAMLPGHSLHADYVTRAASSLQSLGFRPR